MNYHYKSIPCPSRNNKGQINLYIVGVDAAKDIITARFKKSGPEASGAGATHFHKNLDREYFDQLTAERKVIKYFKGFKRIEWQKSEKARNEALDCRVYAYAALQGLISAGINLNREVDILEERLEKLKIEGSLEQPTSEHVPSPAPRRSQTAQPQRKQSRTVMNPYMQGDWR